MPGQDVAGARQAGYSDEEILQFAAQNKISDVAGALKAGYSPKEIVDYLSTPTSAPASILVPRDTSLGGHIAGGAQELGAALNPVTAVKGMARMAAHPIDTLKADAAARAGIWRDAGEAFKKGDYATGVAKALYGAIPLIGEQLSKSGEQFATGEYGKGVGSSVGLGLNLALPGALAKAKIPLGGALTDAIASKLYRGALKPGKGVAAGTSDAALARGLPISSAGEAMLEASKAGPNAVLTEVFGNAPATRTISPGPVVEAIQAVRQKFASGSVSEANLRAVDAAQQQFLDHLREPGTTEAVRNMTPQEAQTMKTQTYRDIKNMKRSAYWSETNSASVEVQQAIARALKDQLEQQFPEVAAPNAELSVIHDIKPALADAVHRSANRNPLGLTAQLAALGGGFMAGELPAGLATAGMMEALRSPMVRSRLAITLARAGKTTVPLATARIQGYLNALGQGAAEPTVAPAPTGTLIPQAAQ